jgi:gliding motility-associated-like protein
MSSVIANCSQSNGSATALVSGGTQPYSYSWSPSGGTGSTTTPVPSTLYTCFVTDAAGCVKKDTITVGHTTGVGASITGAHSICSGDSVLLTATGGGTYAWSTGATTATIYVKNTGNYTVTVTNGCGVTSATVAVLVYPPVTANFTADSLKGYAPLTVNFSNTSSGNATSWAWNFGDGGTATGPNQTHTYTSSGNFPATLTATDANGCSSTHIVIIVVHDIPSSVLVPNVFTPNGDGSNELFYIRSNGLAQLDVKIYDRWGVLMGQISTVNSGWDGRTKTGSQAADGTYYYVLSAKGADGKSFDKQGFFLLIR